MKTSVPLPSRLSTFQSYLSSCQSTPQWGHRVTGSGKANSDICTFLWTGGSVDTAWVKEKAPSNDSEMPVHTEADSSFLQALLHRSTHLTATPPLPNSSQAYFVFLTVDHVPPLRATAISQRRRLSRQSIPIHLDKKWAIPCQVWSFTFLGSVFSTPVKALGLAPLGNQTEHHAAQQLISRVRTVFPARQALPERSCRHVTPRLVGHAVPGTPQKLFH